MAVTTNSLRDFDVQQFTETMQGVFAGKTAFMGSAIVSGGGAVVAGDMPHGPGQIGNTITLPRFGTVDEFEEVAENVALTPKTVALTADSATVAKSGLAFEVTQWAQRPGNADFDPYVELARQTMMQATRFIDKKLVAAAATTPLVENIYSATVPGYLDYDTVVNARAKWGDDQSDIVGMVIHSRTEADLRRLRNDQGDPLLVDSQREAGVPRFCGIPLIVSDLVPLTASSMTTPMTESGTLPDITLAGTPLGPWNLKIKVVTTGTQTTAIMKFSTDGGNTWSANYTNAASVVLTDTAKDSLVGMNGRTGITATMAVGTYTADDEYTSTANLKVSSLVVQKGALAFWYNRGLLRLQTDHDILKDNDVAAIHLYYACNLYKRRLGSTKPGVVNITHNVRNYVG